MTQEIGKVKVKANVLPSTNTATGSVKVGTTQLNAQRVQSIQYSAGAGASAANNAFEKANIAYDIAVASFAQANTARITGNAAYATANASYATGNSAYAMANLAFTTGNAAFAHSNTVYIFANASYAHANASYNTANVAFTSSNAVYNVANAAYATANASYATGNAAYAYTNSTFIFANSAYSTANIAIFTGNASYATANAGYSIANAAYATANAAYTAANNVTPQIQPSFDQANAAYATGNASYSTANSGYATANASYATGNAAYSIANASYLTANASYATSNAAYATANASYTTGNSAYATANASFVSSNNKVSKAGDTMTGTLVINVASNLDALNVSNNNITTIALRPDGHLELFGEANVRVRLSVGNGSYTLLPNLISQFTGNSALYSQVNQQNLNANGTGDFVITTNNGSDTVNYADMGMAGNTYNNTTFNAFPFVNPNDGYFVIVGNDSQNFGGNVFYGTTGSGGSASSVGDITFIQGTDYAEAARFVRKQGLVLNGGTASTSNSTGALVVKGGIGANGAIRGDSLFDSGTRVITVAQAGFDKANAVAAGANSYTDTANTNLKLYVDGRISTNVATLNGSITANAVSANSVINTNISANVATLRGEITSNAASANVVINTNISANVATLRGEISGNVSTLNASITSNAAAINASINSIVSANVATLRGEITANAAANAVSANSVINTNISANVATLRGEISANAVTANSVLYTNISANVATLRGEITANAASANSVLNTNISANVATLRGEISGNVATLNGSITANAASANLVIDTRISSNISSVFAQANAAYAHANAAYDTANTGGGGGSAAIQPVYNHANAAYATANAAYTVANSKFSSSGGTITGTVNITQDLNVSGNLIIGGNTTSISANDLIINDSIIFLANNNTSNILDIGLVGHFTTTQLQHTGVVRDHDDGTWKFFSNVIPNPTTTVAFDANTIYDKIKVGGIDTPYANVNGTDILAYSTSAYSTVNSSITNTNSYISSNVATLRGEISGNVATLNGSITSNIATQNTFTQAAFNKANTLVPTSNGTTSAYASKYLVEYNPSTQSVSYSSKPDASSPYITGYGSEIHVSPVALDDTGRGTIGDPVKTIAQAQVLAALAFETTAAGSRKTIILHPGDYSENVTIDTQFTVLASHELIGKNTTISGTVTVTKGCTIDGLKITNLVISATSAFGSVDIIGCTVTTAVTKTSSAYVNFRACDLSSSSLSITGVGTTILVGGNYGTLTVNNASAGVLAKAVITMGPVTLTAGTLQLADTLIYSATSISNAITQSAGSVLTLNNCQTLIPTLDNVARNSFGGYYSILHSVYDKPNSTFGGVSLNAISHSQYINADRLILSSGGQIVFPDATTQVTAANISTINSSITANAASANSVINTNISANVATLRSEITANAASANSVINSIISANIATILSEFSANAFSANSVINTNISANVAILRGEITANAASANSVIDTNISANVATLRGEISANAVSANSVINTNISANVATLRGEITTNNTTQSTFTQAAFDRANTGLTSAVTSLTANSNTRIIQSATTGVVTFDLATIGTITPGTYTYPSIQVDAYGRTTAISSQTPVTTITANSSSRITQSLTSGAVTFDLATSGVSAGTYGSATLIPTITVDDRGRVTSASNNSISTTINLVANTGSGTVSGGGTLAVNGTNSIATSVSSGTYTITNNGILSFNTRTGAVTLTSSDVTTALGYTPINKTGDTISGSFTGITNLGANTVTHTHGARTSTTFTTASTVQVAIDSFDRTVYRSAKYQVQMTSGSSYHMIELILIHDDTTVYLSQYGEIFSTASLGTFDSTITGSTLSLFVTAANAITTVKMIRDVINI